MSKAHLIDANICRVKEGLRVLEDIARFILKDNALFEGARELRHALEIRKPNAAPEEEDPGASFEENNQRSDLIAIIHANASRVQEGFRVLEEFSEAPEKIKNLRYKSYDLHQALFELAKKRN